MTWLGDDAICRWRYPMARIRLRLDAASEKVARDRSAFTDFCEDVFKWLRANDFGESEFGATDHGEMEFAINGVRSSKVRRVTRWLADELERVHLPVVWEVLPDE